jgi:hypothetical protein
VCVHPEWVSDGCGPAARARATILRLCSPAIPAPSLRMASFILALYYYWVVMGHMYHGCSAVGLAVVVGLADACHLPVRPFARGFPSCCTPLPSLRLPCPPEGCLWVTCDSCCASQLALPPPDSVQLDWVAFTSPTAPVFVASAMVSGSLLRGVPWCGDGPCPYCSLGGCVRLEPRLAPQCPRPTPLFCCPPPCPGTAHRVQAAGDGRRHTAAREQDPDPTV